MAVENGELGDYGKADFDAAAQRLRRMRELGFTTGAGGGSDPDTDPWAEPGTKHSRKGTETGHEGKQVPRSAEVLEHPMPSNEDLVEMTRDRAYINNYGRRSGFILNQGPVLPTGQDYDRVNAIKFRPRMGDEGNDGIADFVGTYEGVDILPTEDPNVWRVTYSYRNALEQDKAWDIASDPNLGARYAHGRGNGQFDVMVEVPREVAESFAEAAVKDPALIRERIVAVASRPEGFDTGGNTTDVASGDIELPQFNPQNKFGPRPFDAPPGHTLRVTGMGLEDVSFDPDPIPSDRIQKYEQRLAEATPARTVSETPSQPLPDVEIALPHDPDELGAPLEGRPAAPEPARKAASAIEPVAPPPVPEVPAVRRLAAEDVAQLAREYRDSGRGNAPGASPVNLPALPQADAPPVRGGRLGRVLRRAADNALHPSQVLDVATGGAVTRRRERTAEAAAAQRAADDRRHQLLWEDEVARRDVEASPEGQQAAAALSAERAREESQARMERAGVILTPEQIARRERTARRAAERAARRRAARGADGDLNPPTGVLLGPDADGGVAVPPPDAAAPQESARDRRVRLAHEAAEPLDRRWRRGRPGEVGPHTDETQQQVPSLRARNVAVAAGAGGRGPGRGGPGHGGPGDHDPHDGAEGHSDEHDPHAAGGHGEHGEHHGPHFLPEHALEPARVALEGARAEVARLEAEYARERARDASVLVPRELIEAREAEVAADRGLRVQTALHELQQLVAKPLESDKDVRSVELRDTDRALMADDLAVMFEMRRVWHEELNQDSGAAGKPEGFFKDRRRQKSNERPESLWLAREIWQGFDPDGRPVLLELGYVRDAQHVEDSATGEVIKARHAAYRLQTVHLLDAGMQPFAVKNGRPQTDSRNNLIPSAGLQKRLNRQRMSMPDFNATGPAVPPRGIEAGLEEHGFYIPDERPSLQPGELAPADMREQSGRVPPELAAAGVAMSGGAAEAQREMAAAREEFMSMPTVPRPRVGSVGTPPSLNWPAPTGPRIEIGGTPPNSPPRNPSGPDLSTLPSPTGPVIEVPPPGGQPPTPPEGGGASSGGPEQPALEGWRPRSKYPYAEYLSTADLYPDNDAKFSEQLAKGILTTSEGQENARVLAKLINEQGEGVVLAEARSMVAAAEDILRQGPPRSDAPREFTRVEPDALDPIHSSSWALRGIVQQERTESREAGKKPAYEDYFRRFGPEGDEIRDRLIYEQVGKELEKAFADGGLETEGMAGKYKDSIEKILADADLHDSKTGKLNLEGRLKLGEAWDQVNVDAKRYGKLLDPMEDMAREERLGAASIDEYNELVARAIQAGMVRIPDELGPKKTAYRTTPDGVERSTVRILSPTDEVKYDSRINDRLGLEPVPGNEYAEKFLEDADEVMNKLTHRDTETVLPQSRRREILRQQLEVEKQALQKKMESEPLRGGPKSAARGGSAPEGRVPVEYSVAARDWDRTTSEQRFTNFSQIVHRVQDSDKDWGVARAGQLPRAQVERLLEAAQDVDEVEAIEQEYIRRAQDELGPQIRIRPVQRNDLQAQLDEAQGYAGSLGAGNLAAPDVSSARREVAPVNRLVLGLIEKRRGELRDSLLRQRAEEARIAREQAEAEAEAARVAAEKAKEAQETKEPKKSKKAPKTDGQTRATRAEPGEVKVEVTVVDPDNTAAPAPKAQRQAPKGKVRDRKDEKRGARSARGSTERTPGGRTSRRAIEAAPPTPAPEAGLRGAGLTQEIQDIRSVTDPIELGQRLSTFRAEAVAGGLIDGDPDVFEEVTPRPNPDGVVVQDAHDVARFIREEAERYAVLEAAREAEDAQRAAALDLSALQGESDERPSTGRGGRQRKGRGAR